MFEPLRLVCWRDRPLVAYTIASRRLRLASVQCLDSHTLKRRLVRMVGMVACRLGADAALARGKGLCLRDAEQVFEGVKQCSKALGEVESVSIVWPADPNRKRLYMHFFDGRGEPLGFGKAALCSSEGERLMAETAAISRLAGAVNQPVCVPRILQVISHEGGHIVLMESLRWLVRARIPSDSELLMARGKFAGETARLSGADLEALSWVAQLQRDADAVGPLNGDIESAIAGGVDCCVVHGDYGCHNARWVGDQIWIYDWERSCVRGPILADEVNIFLGRHVRAIHSRSPAIARRFEREYFRRGRFPREQVLVALAYLHSAGSKLATDMLWALASK